MAYDLALADRIRDLMVDVPGVSEKKMFGGLAFFVNGHLTVSASGQGGLMVRVDPERTGDLVAAGAARHFEMRGRPMKGWLRVDVENLRTKRELAKWVNLGSAYVQSLAPKR